MNIIHQWLEGKKKGTNSAFDLMPEIREEEIKQGGIATADRGVGYNECITDLQDSLPTILSTMEAEIRGRIGEVSTEYGNATDDSVPFNVGVSSERSRIHIIIHSYFNPQE